MTKHNKLGTFFLAFLLCLNLVGCGATKESYYEELQEFSDGFQDIQSDMISASTAFSKDPTSSDKSKALASSLKEISTYLRKGEKLKAPSDLADVQDSFGEACISGADAIDAVVVLLNKGITESNISDFNNLFTKFNSAFSKVGTTLNAAVKSAS